MAPSGRITERWQEWSFERALALIEEVSHDTNSSNAIFFYDELPFYKKIPKAWIQACVSATSIRATVRIESFNLALLRIAISQHFDDKLVEGLICNQLECSPGFNTLSICAKHYRNKPIDIPYKVKTLVTQIFQGSSVYKRLVYCFDQNIRALIKNCNV